jgi:hypothetical protein
LSILLQKHSACGKDTGEKAEGRHKAQGTRYKAQERRDKGKDGNTRYCNESLGEKCDNIFLFFWSKKYAAHAKIPLSILI